MSVCMYIYSRFLMETFNRFDLAPLNYSDWDPRSPAFGIT